MHPSLMFRRYLICVPKFVSWCPAFPIELLLRVRVCWIFHLVSCLQFFCVFIRPSNNALPIWSGFLKPSCKYRIFFQMGYFQSTSPKTFYSPIEDIALVDLEGLFRSNSAAGQTLPSLAQPGADCDGFPAFVSSPFCSKFGQAELTRYVQGSQPGVHWGIRSSNERQSRCEHRSVCYRPPLTLFLTSLMILAVLLSVPTARCAFPYPSEPLSGGCRLH